MGYAIKQIYATDSQQLQTCPHASEDIMEYVGKPSIIVVVTSEVIA